jgi:hypothetical protein
LPGNTWHKLMEKRPQITTGPQPQSIPVLKDRKRDFKLGVCKLTGCGNQRAGRTDRKEHAGEEGQREHAALQCSRREVDV